jgi:hypothetical protein
MKEEKELSAQELYLRMQSLSGIKVGDRVKILRRFTNKEMGVGCNYNEDGKMDSEIGKEGTVLNVCETGIEVDCGSGRDWWWPFFCLEKLVEPPVSFKLNEEYTAVISGDRETVTVGCQKFSREIVLALAEKLKK